MGQPRFKFSPREEHAERALSFTVTTDVSVYLARAAEMRRRAEDALFPDIKAHLLSIAESWESLARAAATVASPFAGRDL